MVIHILRLPNFSVTISFAFGLTSPLRLLRRRAIPLCYSMRFFDCNALQRLFIPLYYAMRFFNCNALQRFFGLSVWKSSDIKVTWGKFQ